ncbi:mechanosensitive ion channel family protein [bacterium]|jgi:small-conductance mechanosensitive channel|nr:mechanosensitive ion channel family protein [bacterium]
MKISKVETPWIPRDKIENTVRPEAAFFILAFAAMSWVFYKLFLRKLSEKRHISLGRQFGRVLFYSLIFVLSLGVFFALERFAEPGSLHERAYVYMGLVSIFFGAVVFIKAARVALFEYLFLGHMNVGVPLLLVNLLTLFISILLMGWFATEILGVHLGPLVATSALLSVILGLALQDTLGNLFAAVSMQFDIPYQIGDWLEVAGPSQKWIGKVEEISWRATVMVGLNEERITIPNRVMAGSQISNFSILDRPIIRGVNFKIPFDIPSSKVRKVLLSALDVVKDHIRSDFEHRVLILETTESWVNYRLIYFMDDYGKTFTVADEVLEAALIKLQQNQIPLATSKLEILKP